MSDARTCTDHGLVVVMEPDGSEWISVEDGAKLINENLRLKFHKAELEEQIKSMCTCDNSNPNIMKISADCPLHKDMME